MPQFCLPDESRLNDFRPTKVAKPSQFFKKVKDIPDDFNFPTIDVDTDTRRKTDLIQGALDSFEADAYDSILGDSQMPLDTDPPKSDDNKTDE